MRFAILLAAAALLAACITAHAQDPDAAYYAGQEDQRAIDMERATNDLLQREQQKERDEERRTEQMNREADDDFIRAQQMQRLRDRLTDMQTQQRLRQLDDEPK